MIKDEDIAYISKLNETIHDLEQIDYSALNVSHGFQTDGFLGGFTAVIKKIKYALHLQFLLGVLGGIIAASAYVAVVYSTKGMPSSLGWLKTILSGLIFPGGIIMITFLGGSLFTSHSMATLPVMLNAVDKKPFFKALFVTLLGNMTGALIVPIIFMGTGAFKDEAFYNAMTSTITHKMFQMGDVLEESVHSGLNTAPELKLWIIAIVSSLFSGILCNFLVSTTLPITFSSKYPMASVAVMFFSLSFFVISGYNHGPANFFFFWSWIVMYIQHPAGVEMFPWWGPLAFLVVNVIPALFGNWLGGGLIMPLILYSNNKDLTQLLVKKVILERAQVALKEVNGEVFMTSTGAAIDTQFLEDIKKERDRKALEKENEILKEITKKEIRKKELEEPDSDRNS
ncbi:formate/nitrite transporter [Spiroplasma sabaudiense Ar-1343]|uniref:Formate/nitrite transporter n=1 Tax=Spiroplasma sabaudiense Ar-1343 TaxID=1276257 RepID=W6A973_9MOLU|nr:formate/nitrite transporter family protein [Spiroplasma sabaudiense]AHI53567.1 formate/nitrite transporter [Spiroplasma sabaudiense Ar-1343]